MNKRKHKIARFAVMLLFIAVTAFTLNRYAMLIAGLLTVNYDWRFELFMVAGQLLFQLPFIYKASKEKKMEYYFNMLLVSFAGSVLLWPLLLVNYFYALSNIVNIICFFGVVLFMFFEHKRRVEKLTLPPYISYTWVLYRFLILIFIIT
jgi:hypothetical protein